MKILTWHWVDPDPKEKPEPSSSKGKPQRRREFFVKWHEVLILTIFLITISLYLNNFSDHTGIALG